MRYLFLSILYFISITIASAQDFKYGKVSKEELAEKVHPTDSSANAAILYISEVINFYNTERDGFMQEREVYERIKIYNKDGYNWATKKVFLYKGGSDASEKLTNIKGVTYNLIDGKIEKDKLKSDGIFDEDSNEYTEINTLTMPNIKDGAIIEYSYKIVSPFLQIDDLYFQSVVPINKLDMAIATPQFYSYNRQINPKAFYAPEIKEDVLDRTYGSTSSSRAFGGSRGTTFERNNTTYFDNVLRISEENIPAIKAEAFSGNIDNYISKMSMELSAVLNKQGVPQQLYSSTWEKVSKTIFDFSSFGDQLKKTKFFEEDVNNLLEGIEHPFEKAAMLHAFVKSKVKWNGNLGYTSRKGIKNAYKEGVGNIGDINLLLTAMLKSQGLEAHPVLVSTMDNGIPIFPTRNGFNYVVSIVYHEGSYMLLDASEFYSAPNVLPLRALNWQGRIIKDSGYSDWVSLRGTGSSSETTFLNVKINLDNSAEGKVRKSITSQSALLYRNEFANMSKEAHQNTIEKGFGDIVVSDLEVEDINNIMLPVKLAYNYRLDNAVDEIGENIYMSPLLFMTDEESPFKLEKRKYPIDFKMPFQQKFVVNIMLPDGYTVDTLPTSEMLNFKEGEATYSYVAKQNGKFLQLNITFDLNNSLIASTEYEVFKAFYEKIIQKQAEQIVLTKA